MEGYAGREESRSKNSNVQAQKVKRKRNPSATADEDQRIRDLASLGYSGQRISRELLPEIKRSRSAVIAYCSRNGIELHGKTGYPPGLPRASRIIEKKREWRRNKPYQPDQKDSLLPPSGSGVHLLEAGRNSCRFIQGDPRYLLICGEPTVRDSSYCAFHTKACRSP